MTSERGTRGRGPVVVLVAVAVTAALVLVGYLLTGGDSGGDPGPTTAEPVGSGPSSRGTTAPSSSPAPSPATTSTSAAAGRWQSGGSAQLGVQYLVPPIRDGWTVAPGESVGYADARGTLLGKASAPAFLKADACPPGRGIGRAWIGVVPTPAGVVESSRSVAASWAYAIGLRADGRTVDQHTPFVSPTAAVDLPGAAATRTTTVITSSTVDPSGCLAPRVELTAQTVRSGAGAVTVVLVRDLGVPGRMSSDLKERVLRSVRPTS